MAARARQSRTVLARRTSGLGVGAVFGPAVGCSESAVRRSSHSAQAPAGRTGRGVLSQYASEREAKDTGVRLWALLGEVTLVQRR